jgi:hypothetical protein
LLASGYYSSAKKNTQEYNGTSWSATNDLATARYVAAGDGDSTDGFAAGGHTGSAQLKSTEEYNGSTWGSGGDLAANRHGLTGGGSSSSAIAMFGYESAVSARTEEYNGSSWSSGGDGITARNVLSGGGSTSNAISMGGDIGGTGQQATEEYAAGSVTYFFGRGIGEGILSGVMD